MNFRMHGAVLALACVAASAALGCRQEVSVANLVEGQRAYAAHCAICHGDYGAGDGEFAPQAAARGHAPPRLDRADRLAELGHDGVTLAIATGAAHLERSNGMPMWAAYLGNATMEQIADYVMVLPDAPEAVRAAVDAYLLAPPGTPSHVRRDYVHNCSGCHGPYGGGDAFLPERLSRQVGAPALADSARFADRTDADVKEILALGGAHAAKAATMPGWINALTDQQRADLGDYMRVLSRTSSR